MSATAGAGLLGSFPSPDLFFETATAYQRTAALKTAVELDLFTAIGEGSATAKALAERRTATERGIRILCDYLTIAGFLVKLGERYELTLDSATFLDRRSPAYLASAVEFLNSEAAMAGFSHLTDIVKHGMPEAVCGVLEPEHPVWVRFARAMAPMMMMPAELLGQLVGAPAGESWKVLDLAAGHGLFGVAIAQQNPNARIVAVDWPNVLEVAAENAQRAGVADRHESLAGSAFDVDYGTGYQLALLTNFLHHFDAPTCERLLRKVCGALVGGGRAAILEFVPNVDRVSPVVPAGFSMTMLGSTPTGDTYTYPEFESMCRNAGFRDVELHALSPTFQHVVVATR